jgi:hypothetical protein
MAEPETLREYYQQCAIKKPEPPVKAKRRDERENQDRTAKIRAYVFGRERNICRICRCRPAESMHELKPRSIGGKVSRANSVAVCGSGTTGCHGFAQSHQVIVAENANPYDADRPLQFQARTRAAAEHLKVNLYQWILSPPMQHTEIAE